MCLHLFFNVWLYWSLHRFARAVTNGGSGVFMCVLEGCESGHAWQHLSPPSPHYCQTNKCCTSPWSMAKDPGSCLQECHSEPGIYSYIDPPHAHNTNRHMEKNVSARDGQHQYYYIDIFWDRKYKNLSVGSLLLCREILMVCSRLWSRHTAWLFQKEMSFAFRL